MSRTFSSFPRARDDILSCILGTVSQILKPPPGGRSHPHDEQDVAMK